MPTYTYETIPENPEEEPRRFEVVQRMKDDALTHDPETGLPVKRVITGGLGYLGGKSGPSSTGGGSSGSGSGCSCC